MSNQVSKNKNHVLENKKSGSERGEAKSAGAGADGGVAGDDAATSSPAKMRASQSFAAKQLCDAVLAVAEKFGLLQIPRKRANAGRVVSPDFMEAAAAAWDQFGARIGVEGFDADAARQAIAERAAYQVAVNAVETLMRRVEYTHLQPFLQWNSGALAIYKLVSAKAELRGNEDMIPVAQNMAKLLATGPREKPPEPPADTPKT